MDRKNYIGMITELTEELKESAKRATSFFSRKITPEGYPKVLRDIAIDYKHPLMWIIVGDMVRANQMLEHVRNFWLRKNGDFKPLGEGIPKSMNPAYQEFYAYTNGWIVRAANKALRDDISIPGVKYLLNLQSVKTGGFYTHDPLINDGITDVLTTAHLGFVCLEAGYCDNAVYAGDYLCVSIEMQPNLEIGFYLRRNASGESVVKPPDEAALIYLVSKNKPNQLYFMVAYPIAFLVELYKVTSDEKYLQAAKSYAEFLLGCHKSVLSCEFSHKLAWALSNLYSVVPDLRYLDTIKHITDYFISIQEENGLWFSDESLKCYDQSAEIVCWFLEIAANLELSKSLVNVRL